MERDRAELRRRKDVLRARMRALRAAVPAGERGRLARRMEGRMLSLPEIRAARSVLVFASFGSEIPTEGLIRRLAEDAVLSRRLFLPALTPEDMVALPYRPGDSLLRASYGPLEPAAGAPADPREFDAVIAPGLAFDRDGYRLGHGGGHFDRYLAALRPDAARIGVAFALQIVDEVPHGARDEPLDVVVTDQETFRCGRR